MEPIVSKPCHFKLNPNDLRVVENKLNELKHAAKSSPADTISEGGTAGLTKDNIEKVLVKDLQHELDARGQPTGGLRPALRMKPYKAAVQSTGIKPQKAGTIILIKKIADRAASRLFLLPHHYPLL